MVAENTRINSLIWFRNDLRIDMNSALAAALEAGPTIAIYYVCLEQWRSHDMGERRVVYQQQALAALAQRLQELRVPLLIRRVDWFRDVSADLEAVVRRYKIRDVFWNNEYPLNERRRDTAVLKQLNAGGVTCHRFEDDACITPGTIRKADGTPYQVFTPFFKRWWQRVEEASEPSAASLRPQAPLEVKSSPLPRSIAGIRPSVLPDGWQAGERVALDQLQGFLENRVADYASRRDVPSVAGTSGLSAALAIGTLSVARCVQEARRVMQDPDAAASAKVWIKELAWRDFYRHIVAQHDRVSLGLAFARDKDDLPWRHDTGDFERWCSGTTGYPLVDAGMRQLNQTGWMHNRLRMITAMFLVKHLLIDWHWGERYFMQQLVDGDFASNNGGWQWCASTGTDAAPYFRIFNPESQAQKFDPQQRFIARYVPEAGGDTYSAPIVAHKWARERALAFFRGKG